MEEQPSNALFPADENTDIIPRVVRARRARGAIALVLGVGALGAAGVTFALPANHVVAPETRTALEAQAQAVASALQAAAGAAHVRANRIATHDTVRAAIQTDAATAVDMMKSDFNQTPIKDEKLIQGETLELFQLVNGAPAALARMPAEAASLAALAGQSTRVARMGDGVAVVVSAPVERFKDGPGYQPVDGLLVMASPVNLDVRAPGRRGGGGQRAAGRPGRANLAGRGPWHPRCAAAVRDLHRQGVGRTAAPRRGAGKRRTGTPRGSCPFVIPVWRLASCCSCSPACRCAAARCYRGTRRGRPSRSARSRCRTARRRSPPPPRGRWPSRCGSTARAPRCRAASGP